MEHEIVICLNRYLILAPGDGSAYQKGIEFGDDLSFYDAQRLREKRILGSVEGNVFFRYVLPDHIPIKEILNQRNS